MIYHRTFLILLFGTVINAAVPGYGQCGGSGYTGETTCAAGYSCQYSNPYYSQCVPIPVSSTGTTKALGPYDQCGGSGWTGSTVCSAGYTCQYSNPYYSQCLPSSQTTTSTTSTKTIASTTSTKSTQAIASTTTTTSLKAVTSTTSTTSTIPIASTTSATATTKSLGPYDQCGGSGWTGSTACPAGYTCQYSNPYYSQCTPVPVSSSTGTTKALGPYDQCGGSGWTGSTVCSAGYTCQYSNPYYSQCLPTSGTTASGTTSTQTLASTSATTSTKTTGTTLSTVVTTSVTSSASTLSSTSAASSASIQSSTSTSSTTGSNPTYKASFTHYGAGDTFGSPNCNTNTAACGFYTYPGYSAAISQNFYGAGPGQGAGPACGTCWRLTGQTDYQGNPLSNAGTTIVVMINNLCPAEGNPLCAQSGQSGTNQYGANVNFDLCSDSGAQEAFFGNDGQGLAVGTATQVDCSQWSGTVVH